MRFILTLSFIFVSFQLHAGSPSFDCRKATQPDEFAICASARLSELDRIIDAGYKYLRSVKGKYLANQIGLPFLRMRQACGPNVGCIAQRQIESIRAYQGAGAPVSVPIWAKNTQTTEIKILPEVVINGGNGVQVRIISAEIQRDYDDVYSQGVLFKLVADHLRSNSSISGSQIKLMAVSKRLNLLTQKISKIEHKVEREYSTPIRPTNANLGVTALKASEIFPKVPYYIAGTKEEGEMWVKPKVSNLGELLYDFNFMDPRAEYGKVKETITMIPSEVGAASAAFLKVSDWSEIAIKKGLRTRFEKIAECFPSDMCLEKVIGNASTEIIFMLYEDGSTAAKVQRNKGAFKTSYNLSVESGVLLAAYLDYMKDLGEAEFHTGTMDEEDLDEIFK